MAIELKSTRELAKANGVKALVYGLSGSGKTTLIRTLPSPVILSAESGLLSLGGEDLPVIEITSMAELQEAYSWCAGSTEAEDFESIALDSISEIAEVILTGEKKTAKDPRQAYGALADQMTEMVKAFRDLPGKHVYFSAKAEKSDVDGKVMYAPGVLGTKVSQMLPYFFDLCLALRVERTEGVVMRALQTQSDGAWQAKDRSGKLEPWEGPDMGAIIRKITT